MQIATSMQQKQSLPKRHFGSLQLAQLALCAMAIGASTAYADAFAF
jgi:hypothetical protein